MIETPKTDSLKKMLVDVFTNKRYMLIICFATFWMVSVHISAPFSLVYARTVLDLSNTVITLAMQILPSICMVLVLPMWGRALDKFGNKPVMMISARVVCFAPFFWALTFPGPFAVIPIIFSSITVGFLSAGLDFGTQNVFLGQAPEKNRSMYVAIYSCITSLVGIGFANTSGGWLLDNVLAGMEGFLVLNRYNYLFVISAALRIIAAFVLLPRMISEENTTPIRTILKSIKIRRRRLG
jgi:MFS family permease